GTVYKLALVLFVPIATAAVELSKFVVFSDDNPFNKQYDAKMADLVALKLQMLELAKRDVPGSPDSGPLLPGVRPGRDDAEVYLSLPPFKASIWVEDKRSGLVIWKLEGKENVEKFSAPFKNREELERAVKDFLVFRGILLPSGKEYVTIVEAGQSGHNKGDVVSIDKFLEENKKLKSKGLLPARGWIKSRGTLVSDGNGGRDIEWNTQTKGFYWRIVNKETGEILEYGQPYTTERRAKGGAVAWIKKTIRRGDWAADNNFTVILYSEPPGDTSEHAGKVAEVTLGAKELEFLPHVALDSLLEPERFPKRTKALEKMKPYSVAHTHDDGDLTIISGGKLWVVTTEGE
ncbi:hypothetical protein LCGC14_3092510, partial [marine sediment metagenome]